MLRVSTFHAGTVVSQVRVRDDGVLHAETVCYDGRVWYRVWPLDGRRVGGVKGGSLVVPCPVLLSVDVEQSSTST